MGSLDIISELLGRDIDLALQIIFLSLDPVSLKSSRLVCHQWSMFIKRRIVPKLKKHLLYQWKNATPKAKSLQFDETIRSLSCDESILVCGMNNGLAKVYNFITLDHVTDLDCNPIKSLLSRLTFRSSKGHVHSDIGRDIVAAVTSKGVVSVWRTSDWSNLYKNSLHSLQDESGWPHWRIPFIKVLSNMIMVLTNNVPKTAEPYEIKTNWNLDILSWDGTNAVLLTSVGEDAPVSMPTLDYLRPNTVVHLFDADEDYILLAKGDDYSVINLELWSLLTNTIVAKADMDFSTSSENWNESVRVNTAILSYPFAILGTEAVTAPGNSCIVSLNLHTGEVVNRIDFHTSRFDIHHNGFKLIASPENPHNHKNVVLYSLQDLKSPVHQLDMLKRGQKIESEKDYMSSCLNTAGVAVAQGPYLYVWDFWYCNVYDDADSWPQGKGFPSYEEGGGVVYRHDD